MKHEEGRFTGQGGVGIYWQLWAPQQISAVVLIAHGLGEHGGRYTHVAEALAQIGCAVYALDHRGHGKSDGQRAYIDRFAHAVADMDQMVDLINKQKVGGHRKLPFFLLGHSMGGALSLSYAMKHGERLSGLILSGPALVLQGAPWLIRQVSKLMSSLVPKAGVKAVDPTLVSRDPAEVARYVADPLNAHGRIPARTLGEILSFAEWVPAAVSIIQLPLLVQHGGDDRLTGASGSRRLVAQASSKDKTLKIYEGLYHEIYNELADDRRVVLKDLQSWVKARMA